MCPREKIGIQKVEKPHVLFEKSWSVFNREGSKLIFEMYCNKRTKCEKIVPFVL